MESPRRASRTSRSHLGILAEGILRASLSAQASLADALAKAEAEKARLQREVEMHEAMQDDSAGATYEV